MNINEASAQEEAEKEQEELESYLSIPPGGPVYTPNSIGPITRVPEFEASMILELQVTISFPSVMPSLSCYYYLFVYLCS